MQRRRAAAVGGKPAESAVPRWFTGRSVGVSTPAGAFYRRDRCRRLEGLSIRDKALLPLPLPPSPQKTGLHPSSAFS